MKKKYILLSMLFFVSFAFAQNKTIVTYPNSFAISKPLTELFEKSENYEDNTYKESEDKALWKAHDYVFGAKDGKQYQNSDKVIQRAMGTKALSAPLTNWAGLTGGSCPLDPTGAVSTSHYIQAINASPFKIFNKTTGALVGVVRNIGALWSPATANAGDPIVMYDKYADRWFISQFGDPQQVYIAISTTNDPTGTYYTYNFTMPAFTDYLKFSIWADGYYMSSNGTNFVNVFERNAMLTGNPSARVLTANITAPNADFWSPLSGDADGVLPPLGTPCPLIYYTDNGWGGTYTDAVRIHSMTTVWSGTPSLTISAPTTIPVAAFDSSYDTVNWKDVAQGTGTTLIDAIGGATMYRSQWRKWTGYNTLLACWAVKMSAGVYSTKWVELRQDQVTNNWSVYQDAIYAPDGLSRWIASIAMDDNGSIGLSYLCTGKTPTATSPSLRYTGRLSTDPLGQMTFAEQTAAPGAGASGCGQRVGDYSHTSLDPDGLTFWHTGMYFNSGSKTQVYSYRITPPLGVNNFLDNSMFSIYQQGKDLVVNASLLNTDKDVIVDIFDLTGKQIKGKIVRIEDGKINAILDISELQSAVYLVRVGNLDFQKVVKVLVK